MRHKTWLGACAAVALAVPAYAQDYVIGLSSALTGPPASTYAPMADSLRLYLDRVNAAGGVNGHKITLVVQDDSAEPSKAAANARKLVTQDNVLLVINASLSSTYAPVVAEIKRAEVPVMFANGVCPREVYPPADPLQFCTTAYAAGYDSRAALAFIRQSGSGALKVGFAAMAIPVSRAEIDLAEEHAKSIGLASVGKEVIPPATADYTPFATKLKEAGAAWVFSWAPWVTQVRTFEALRRLGWDGSYISWGHIEAEGELARIKDPKFFTLGANALFQDGLPIHKTIEAAAAKAGSKYPANQMAEGWLAGQVVEAALKKISGPADAKKMRAALETVAVDTQGLRGGPLEWTKDNHFRLKQHYRVYRWDTGTNAIVRAQDWVAHEVK